MKLFEIQQYLFPARVIGDSDIEITGIEVDSRKVAKGCAFICLAGFTVDGHDYAAKAVENGAALIISQRELPLEATQIIVKDTRLAMAVLADAFYGHPSKQLKVIGVTGTNGKTTTTYLIEKLLADQGHQSGLIGTMKMKIGIETFAVKNTTPDSLDLQKSFAKMLEVPSKYAIMEVSSHALALGRVKGVNYQIAVFTNLTQDHLDYHKTMENYRESKGLLFSRLGNSYNADPSANSWAVLNADDLASEYFAKLTSQKVLTYGIDNQADIRATKIVYSAQGASFHLESPFGRMDFSLKMLGKFSVYNTLAALAVGLIEGIPLDECRKSLEEMAGVEGRFELVNDDQDFTVVVDYAHTPDSLENVLKTVQEFVQGRVICVFGAGGDRDKTKRPLMGELAVRYSDLTIITSDNPRTEEPEQIIQDILVGVKRSASSEPNYLTIIDRTAAIDYAIAEARSGDVVLIAGKGHETYQILKDQTTHFDDREVAHEAIRRRRVCE